MSGADRIRIWRENPKRFVIDNFKVELDRWQEEALDSFHKNNRICMKASKGPGKTCCLAWMVWNFLATRPHPNIACTSITSDNLSDGLWKELAKWQNKSQFLKDSFVWTKTRIFAKNHTATWWASARTWSKGADSTQQAHTLAGLHEEYCMFILDEVGGIPDAVMAAAEAGLASGTETKIIIAGNPTHTEGPLYRACTSERDLWKVIEINGDPDNPNRAKRVDIKWARDQISKYGRDNPWVLVNVFGQFPPSSLNTLIGPDEVREAMKRHLPEEAYNWAQKRLGIDVSRYGDDSTCISPRQGKAAFKFVEMRHVRDSAVSVNIANRVMSAKRNWDSDIELFDDTVGWAHGAIDVCRSNGLSPIPVSFHAPAYNPRYLNMRAQMWFDMCQWIKEGGALPNDTELIAELTTPKYIITSTGKLKLEDKDITKEAIGRSPNKADSLALTFAIPEMPKDQRLQEKFGFKSNQGNQVLHEYDPFEEARL